jgi:hypothetical protein
MEEIEKTLGHAAMHVLDICGLVAEWVQHAELKASVVDQKVAEPQGGRPEGGITRAAKELPIPGKTLLGRRRYIERAIKINTIWEEAKVAARAARLDDTKCDLLAIANERSLEAQLAKVRELAARRSTPRRKAKEPTKVGTTSGADHEIQDSIHFTEPAVRQDKTLTAEQQTELTRLRARWNDDGVLQRAELRAASPIVQRQLVADLFAATPSINDRQEVADPPTIDQPARD